MSIDLEAAVQTLTKRVQELEDINSIRALKYRYLNACDEKDPNTVKACFIDNASIIYPGIGEFNNCEDFVAIYAELACNDHIADMHHAQNPSIEMTGPDTAKGKVVLRFLQINTEQKTCSDMSGHYEDEYQKIDGQWYIAKTHFKTRVANMTSFENDTVNSTFAGLLQL